MNLPVWVEQSQLDCCMPDFAAGAMLTSALVIEDAEIEPAADGPLGWTSNGDGEIAFLAYASGLERPGALPTILDVGACRIGTRDVAMTGFARGAGEVVADWHGLLESPGVDAGRLADAITATGVVTRIFRVPVVYERRGKYLVPARREDPVEVGSTEARREGDLLLLDFDIVRV